VESYRPAVIPRARRVRTLAIAVTLSPLFAVLSLAVLAFALAIDVGEWIRGEDGHRDYLLVGLGVLAIGAGVIVCHEVSHHWL
jgi:hypothetical protein